MNILGRLTLSAIPIHQPIPLVAGGAVGAGLAAVLAVVAIKGYVPYLWREWITSVDHKRIGVMYVLLAMVMLLRGFSDAIMMRSQQALAFRAPGYLPPEHYDQVFSAHGTLMILFVAMPFMIGLMNFVVPSQLGVRDVAFPTFNSAGFWLTATGALLVNMSLVIGEFARTGWLPYPPLSESSYSPGVGVDYYLWSLEIAGIGTLISGVNLVTTVLKMRAPGMTYSRIAGDGTTFTVHFGASTSDAIGSARSEILKKVHRYLSHAAIPLVISGTVPGAPLPAPQGIETLLARSELWSGMTDRNRTLLAERFEFTSLDEGQLLYREGDKADTLYVVASGTMQIVVGDPAAPQIKHRMSPGETIGALALITGQSIHATAQALTDAGLYRLREDALASAMSTMPELAADLEQTVARAQQLIARFAAVEGEASMAHPAALLDRLRGFIRRLGAPAFQ